MKDHAMKNLFVFKWSKASILLVIAVLFAMNKTVTANEQCNMEQSNSNYCHKVQNLNILNQQTDMAFNTGSVINISQPPLVVIPKIEIKIPNQIDSRKQITLRPKSTNRINKNIKLNLNEGNIKKIFDVLDNKGKKHLSQCMAKISENRLKNNYPAFADEILSLKKIVLKGEPRSDKIGAFLSRRPSQKDCFKYLDFIFMIS